ncbi:putative ras GTPase-activating protein sar1 [Myxozyma melibiosi]|uniref:Ras GTPase-activating protein sar1 n=1 Tax=Myxozyma melibiosi TaxID=54550 RepID=A0ABR1F7K5_9ASCO
MATAAQHASSPVHSPVPSVASRPTSRYGSGQTQHRSSRHSAAAYSISLTASVDDSDIDDDLARAQARLRELKAKISAQSKENFLLERDVRNLDSRIALLIENKLASEESEPIGITNEAREGSLPDRRKLDFYSNLFFILQTEPQYIATLCTLLSMSEMDSFLQTVMFTIYGNQYEQREENLLLSMFQSVLAYQFESTTEFSSLLRANTPVSRLMTTYTRRGPGQSYLKSALADQINYVNDHADVNLEINPLKIYDEVFQDALQAAHGDLSAVGIPRVVSSEVAAANERVREIMRPRVELVQKITGSFFAKITSSLHLVPYGIRWICKQIRALTRRRYPATEESAVCSLIGAFFFLRFINPAIVSPHSYMLVERQPGERPRRTLILVAKILQALANDPAYAKEPYMLSFAGFVDDNKAQMNKFLNDLCEVPDFHESLEFDSYVALSKTNLELSITINEILSMHQLLEKHSHALSSDKRSRLNVILRDLGQAPPVLPRKDNITIALPLFSRFQSEIEEQGQKLDITAIDLLLTEAKSVVVQILRSVPDSHAIAHRPLDLKLIAQFAASDPSDQSIGLKGLRLLSLSEDLFIHYETIIREEARSPKTSQDEEDQIDYEVRARSWQLFEDMIVTLSSEIEDELAQLGSLREKVASDISSLESVLATISEHNVYLKGQLASYNSYLTNVRLQSGAQKSTLADRRGGGLLDLHGKSSKTQKSQLLGPYKFTTQAMQKEGVIAVYNVPEQRVRNLYFMVHSSMPGSFTIGLHYKGKSSTLIELNLKLDDLLEMLRSEIHLLDLEYVKIYVPKMLEFLQKQFKRR